MDTVALLVNIPCPTFEEAEKLGTALLSKKLCGLVRVYSSVHQIYDDGDSISGEDIVMLAIKTTQVHLKNIESYVFENHSWGTPCVDAVPIVTDHC